MVMHFDEAQSRSCLSQKRKEIHIKHLFVEKSLMGKWGQLSACLTTNSQRTRPDPLQMTMQGTEEKAKRVTRGGERTQRHQLHLHRNEQDSQEITLLYSL